MHKKHDTDTIKWHIKTPKVLSQWFEKRSKFSQGSQPHIPTKAHQNTKHENGFKNKTSTAVLKKNERKMRGIPLGFSGTVKGTHKQDPNNARLVSEVLQISISGQTTKAPVIPPNKPQKRH